MSKGDVGIPGEGSRPGTITHVPILRLFASAREAAGTSRDDVPGATVGEVLATAADRYGSGFVSVLGTCRIWVNGEAAGAETPLSARDEVAVLPPVSGGAV